MIGTDLADQQIIMPIVQEPKQTMATRDDKDDLMIMSMIYDDLLAWPDPAAVLSRRQSVGHFFSLLTDAFRFWFGHDRAPLLRSPYRIPGGDELLGHLSHFELVTLRSAGTWLRQLSLPSILHLISGGIGRGGMME